MLEAGSTLHADRRSPARPECRANSTPPPKSNVAQASGDWACHGGAQSAVENTTGLAEARAFPVKGAVDGSRMGGLSCADVSVQR